MSLKAGRLRHLVAIQQYVAQTDTSGNVLQDETTGEVTKAWATLATVRAAIEPLSVREFVQSAATQSEVSARIVIRYRAGMSADMRLVHMVNGVAGAIYNPHGFLADPDTGLEYLTVPCSLGANDGQ